MSSRNSTMTIPLEKELPRFALNSEHPYHIIVVASQECPTASGVLAGRVRTLDGKGWTNMLENYLCGGSCYDSDDESGSSGSEDDHEIANVRRSEDGGTPASETASSKLPPPVTSRTSREDDAPRSQAPSIHGSNSGDSRRRRGPYVLVEKERLMGIYIAVFVARSCEDLLEGVSKSRVPAGLIGGRLGNKGGAHEITSSDLTPFADRHTVGSLQELPSHSTLRALDSFSFPPISQHTPARSRFARPT